MSHPAVRKTPALWSRRLGQPWHSAILALVGVVCGLIALGNWRATDQFLADSVPADGMVVEQSRDGSTLYPVVAFRDTHGIEHRVRARTSPAIAPLMLQQKVGVRYLQAMPERASIDGFWELWIDTVVSALLAAAFLGGALLLWAMREDFYSLGDGARAPQANTV